MYAEFYGLSGEPFLLAPDHSFYFESSCHAQAMAHLAYGLSRREGFIVITGEVGAGKTTLVKHLCASIDREKIVAAHVVTTSLSGHDLLNMVAAAFGLDSLPDSKSALLLRLQRFFEHIHRQGRHAVLAVDEAQNLSFSALEELRMLSNFQVGNAAPFQSFLIGQPQFRDLVARPELEQLRQRVIASYHMGPLSAEECREYLIHRLRRVGWKEDPIFDESALEAIFQHSGGIPREINTLTNRVMLLGFLDELHRFTADEVKKVVEDLSSEARRLGRPDDQTTHVNGNGHHLPDGIAERISGVEKRLAIQESFLRQTAVALQQFLNMSEDKSARREACDEPR
jgi:putative secretion ATPase (PEP-CTERM system associated)